MKDKRRIKMKILFSTYSKSFEFKGGGHIIMEKIKEYMQKKGVKVEIKKQNEAKFKEYDLAHNFDVMKESLPFLEKAKANKKKVAIHPFFTYSFDAAFREKIPFMQRIKMLAYNIVNRYDPFHTSYVRKEMRLADLLFPNSEMEAKIITKDFGISRKKVCIVPDGVDERFFFANEKEFRKKFGIKEEFVLFVGRIEPRKNIVRLIKALDGTGIPLVIIGPADPEKEYFNECKKIAGTKVRFLGEIPHNSSLLASAYSAAKVFALPSWDETPGMTALEAGAAGCSVVITERGCTKEYFKDFVEYVNPESTQEVREKILKQFKAKKTKALSGFIKKNYSWERVAEEVLQAYKRVL